MHSTLTQTWFYDVFPGTSRVEFLNSYSDFVSSKRYLLFLVFLCLCVPFFVREIFDFLEISSFAREKIVLKNWRIFPNAEIKIKGVHKY